MHSNSNACAINIGLEAPNRGQAHLSDRIVILACLSNALLSNALPMHSSNALPHRGVLPRWHLLTLPYLLMLALLLIFPIVGIALGLMLLRGQPRLRKVWVCLFVIAYTAIMLGVGFVVGEVGPLYQASGAIRGLVRDTHRSLEAGDYVQARAAFSEASSLLEAGGEPYDAVTIIAKRLGPPPSPATPAAPPQ